MSAQNDVYRHGFQSSFKTVCRRCETQWSSVLRMPGDYCEDEPEDGQVCHGVIVRDYSKGKP
jgi:hypothetical protein